MNTDRLFIATNSTGISYADRARSHDGDYLRLAFLPYDTLALEVYPDCTRDLRQLIDAHANGIIAQAGEEMIISACGQTMTIGSARHE